jgi:hypothetical protein
MLIVSHRGNINGPVNDLENSPKQIDLAISKGFLVEIDLRIINGEYWLGHDNPDYKIGLYWILDRADKLIVHSKDLVTANELFKNRKTINWFYHTDEDIVLTSWGWIWAYPKIYLNNAITVLEEKNLSFPKHILGVCTDYPILASTSINEK